MDQVSQKVTKPKNQGRVEAGKKLAEWNRANKAKLTQVETSKNSSTPASTSQVPAQVPASTPASTLQVPAQVPASTSASTSQEGQEPVAGPHKFSAYVAGGIAVLTVCVAVYYIKPSIAAGVRPEGPSQQQKPSKMDIFKMR